MANEGVGSASKNPSKAFVLISVCVVMAMAWLGALDKMSGAYVDSSLKKAVAAFATARAIDAAISVVQSTTVSVQLGAGVQISPGETLAPINDLVEDYSGVMKVAIVSLVIQKILLAIVTKPVFNLLLTLSGLALISSIVLKAASLTRICFRVFLSLAILRYILVAVVSINGVVSYAFIDGSRDEAMSRLEALPAEVEQQSEVGVGKAAEGNPENPNVEELSGRLEAARARLREASELLESVKSTTSITDRLNPFRDNKRLDAAVAAEKESEAEVTNLLVRRCAAMRSSGDVDADAACSEVPLLARAAEAASAAGQAASGAAKAMVGALDVTKLREKVEAAISDMVNAMALFLLQTLVLPLLFLFALSRASKAIWGIDIGRRVSLVVTKRPAQVPVAQG